MSRDMRSTESSIRPPLRSVKHNPACSINHTRRLATEIIAGARENNAELQALKATGSATFIAVDAATAEGPQQLADAAAKRGGVDILVNITGAVPPRRYREFPLERHPP